ncbi:MAG TPA: non-canonical purine NTP pyrophosphatase [Patescibacteria group bacterium]
MPLTFITGNQGKFEEVKSLIPDVQQIDLELDEIQELDPQQVIAHKLTQALAHQPGPLIVEDTSLVVDDWNGLPGPLIKWFLKSVGNQGLWQMASGSGHTAATAKTCIGYADAQGNITFFEGEVKGRLAEPRGDRGFGWDNLFQPDGSDKTFAEMSLEEKNQFSMRQIAVLQLKTFLDRS